MSPPSLLLWGRSVINKPDPDSCLQVVTAALMKQTVVMLSGYCALQPCLKKYMCHPANSIYVL